MKTSNPANCSHFYKPIILASCRCVDVTEKHDQFFTSVAEMWRKHRMFDVDKWKGSFFLNHQKLAFIHLKSIGNNSANVPELLTLCIYFQTCCNSHIHYCAYVLGVT